MKRLALMRHGHSPSALAANVDSDALRPLSESGLKDARASAERMKTCGVGFGLVLHSPLLRAEQTAAAVSEVLGLKMQVVQELDGACGPAALWAALATYFDADDSYVAVGHQPAVGLLAGALLRQPPIAFSPADFVLLGLGEREPLGAIPHATLELSWTN